MYGARYGIGAPGVVSIVNGPSGTIICLHREGIEVIDEIEDIPVGETQELTVTLEAGNYVLLCRYPSALRQWTGRRGSAGVYRR